MTRLAKNRSADIRPKPDNRLRIASRQENLLRIKMFRIRLDYQRAKYQTHEDYIKVMQQIEQSNPGIGSLQNIRKFKLINHRSRTPLKNIKKIAMDALDEECKPYKDINHKKLRETRT